MSAATHRLSARIPHHEVGPFGEVRSGALVRLLQEAAIEASTAAGFPERWYREAGTQWVVRRTRIVLLDRLRGGDPLEVATWVADVRRVRSRREYAVDGARGPVARGWSDWVYVDLARGRPVRVPQAMIDAFRPELGDDAHERESLGVGDPPARAFRLTHEVRLRDLDGLGHANNATLVDLVDEALIAALGAVGHPFETIVARGPFPQLVEIDVEYLGEARFGETLESRIWRFDAPLSESRFRTAFEACRAGAEPTMRATATWRWIDPSTGEEGRGSAAVSLPDT